MLTWKSRAISRIVDRRAFASAPGKSALCVSESACPVGTPRGNPLPASCWGFGSMANPDWSMLNSNLKNGPVWLRLQLKSVIKCITPKNRHSPGCQGFGRHALIYCLPGALKVAMIRGLGMVRRDWIMLAPSGTRASPAPRAGTNYGNARGHRFRRS
jgi:hypothetical protein